MGIAITGMRYTGMAAAHFPPGSISSAANDIDSQWLATIIILLTFAILIVTLILSRYYVAASAGERESDQVQSAQGKRSMIRWHIELRIIQP